MFILQLRVLGERRVRRALAIDPLAQHTFVVETDICGKQASVVFVYVVAQLTLPLGVRAYGLVKIHVDFPDQGGHPLSGPSAEMCGRISRRVEGRMERAYSR